MTVRELLDAILALDLRLDREVWVGGQRVVGVKADIAPHGGEPFLALTLEEP